MAGLPDPFTPRPTPAPVPPRELTKEQKIARALEAFLLHRKRAAESLRLGYETMARIFYGGESLGYTREEFIAALVTAKGVEGAQQVDAEGGATKALINFLTPTYKVVDGVDEWLLTPPA